MNIFFITQDTRWFFFVDRLKWNSRLWASQRSHTLSDISKVFNEFFWAVEYYASTKLLLLHILPSPEVIHQGPLGPHTKDQSGLLPPSLVRVRNGHPTHTSIHFSSFCSYIRIHTHIIHTNRYRAMQIMWG